MGKVKEADPHIWQVMASKPKDPVDNIIEFVHDAEDPLWKINILVPKKLPKNLKFHEGVCPICSENSTQLVVGVLYPHDRQLSCLDCYVWENRQRAYSNYSIVVIGKYCYYIGSECLSYSRRGFGGRKFRIKYKNGQIITTTNLVDLGKVPEKLQHKMPNNANFV